MSFFLDNPNGLSVSELRKVIGRIPEVDEDGNEAKIYITCGNAQTSALKIATLDEDGDLLLVPDFWQAVMEETGCWEDYIDG
tara:strand:+ start:530 stop:775 length:246 start_codon:yes stop_codon:yes gene_type:complete